MLLRQPVAKMDMAHITWSHMEGMCAVSSGTPHLSELHVHEEAQSVELRTVKWFLCFVDATYSKYNTKY